MNSLFRHSLSIHLFPSTLRLATTSWLPRRQIATFGYIEPPPQREIVLHGVAENVKPDDIRRLVGHYGEIERVELLLNASQQQIRFANLTFKNLEDAKRLVENTRRFPLQLFDQTLRAYFRQPVTSETVPPTSVLFVGTLPRGVRKTRIVEAFKPFGAIKITHEIRREKVERSFAYVHFRDVESAMAVMALHKKHPISVWHKTISLQYSKAYHREFDIPQRKILVFDYKRDPEDIQKILVEKDLWSHVTAFSHHKHVFIEFFSTPIATKALEILNKLEMPNGDILKVSYSRPKAYEAGGNLQNVRWGGEGNKWTNVFNYANQKVEKDV